MKPIRTACLLGVLVGCGCAAVPPQAGVRQSPPPIVKQGPLVLTRPPTAPAAVLDRPVAANQPSTVSVQPASQAPVASLERPVSTSDQPSSFAAGQ
jgi:hypothetical protein